MRKPQRKRISVCVKTEKHKGRKNNKILLLMSKIIIVIPMIKQIRIKIPKLLPNIFSQIPHINKRPIIAEVAEIIKIPVNHLI